MDKIMFNIGRLGATVENAIISSLKLIDHKCEFGNSNMNDRIIIVHVHPDITKDEVLRLGIRIGQLIESLNH